MSKYCRNSPACEEDVCRCDKYNEENNDVGFRKLSKIEYIVLSSMFIFFLLLPFLITLK